MAARNFAYSYIPINYLWNGIFIMDVLGKSFCEFKKKEWL